MSRRALTLLLASTLLLGLALFAGASAVPYVALAPGPTFNTLGENNGREVIKISGRKTYPDSGNLNLTTISVINRLTLLQAVRGWLQRDLAVVPREVVYPPKLTVAEVREQDIAAMTQSKDSATTAALRQIGIPGITKVVIEKVSDGSPAAGKLQAGDVITAVDGAAVSRVARLIALIGARKPGQPVVIRYVRGATSGQARIVTASAREPDGSVRPVVGVLTSERTDFPVKVDIALKDVGGPSAGLMFSLGIVDKLTPGSLTNGAFIAGSGEIDSAGNVGPIGGIQQKLIGAKKNGATVFLVPKGNCAAALDDPPKGLRLISVASLKDALGQLARLAEGKATTPCTA